MNCAFNPWISRLADDEPGLGLVAAVVDHIDVFVFHLADERREIFVTLPHRLVHRLFEAGRVHRLHRLVGDAFAVGGLVVNNRDPLSFVVIGEILAGEGALSVVTAAGPEDVVPALLHGIVGQGRARRGRRHLQHPRLVVNLGRRNRRGRAKVPGDKHDALSSDVVRRRYGPLRVASVVGND
jgi:hypothetical protein